MTSYILCDEKPPVWLSLLSRWSMSPGLPITMGLLAQDLGRPTNQIPHLEKLKPTVDEQGGGV